MDEHGGDPVSLAGKIAVVTGAGRSGKEMGVGSAIARLLARRGATVAIVDRDQSAAAATLVEIEAEAGRAWTLLADVSKERDCAQVTQDLAGKHGRVDILVNNVGIGGPRDKVRDFDLTSWNSVMAVNVTGAFLMCKHLLPLMPAGSTIINISSIAARFGGLATAYNVSKGALESLTITLATQYGSVGIRANSIVPGQIWTEIVARSLANDHDLGELRELRRRQNLLETEGTAWDVAEGAAFLASDASRWITGQTLNVDGGFSLRSGMV